MQIICAGFPKTGTKSMAKALRELGYIVHDFEEHVDLHLDDYLDFLEGRKDSKDLMEAYGDVDAVVDQPVCTMWNVFYKHYPNAKVILMERESSEAWHKSYSNMLNYYNNNYKSWAEAYLHWFSGTQYKLRRFTHHCMVRSAAMFDHFTDSNAQWSKENWIYQYEMHNAAVRYIVPPEQLLVFQTGEGWDRLCQFLDKPVPDIPFPRENIGGTAGNIVDQMQEFKTLSAIDRELKRNVTLCTIFATVTLSACLLAYIKPDFCGNVLSKTMKLRPWK